MAGGIAAAAAGAVRHLTAREVKLADLADNTDPGRLATLTESDRARLTGKYGDAYGSSTCRQLMTATPPNGFGRRNLSYPAVMMGLCL
ncbi:hypothetical protein B5M45_02040 [Mycobacterium simiae]|uniref:Uncharacterized protein n=1 Tax=Mycobacterium simiae TaxID=1784 RepID=A0A1X0YGE4_MYCSI|nr:hypothetical protein B5M45_02040 [Mycobacterium simiae]